MADSILTGVDDEINRALGLTKGRLRYHHKEQCQLFSTGNGPALDAQALIEKILNRINRNWNNKPSRSDENWRWTTNTELDPQNTSREVILERWIARTPGKRWANQVPVASGLTAKAGGRRAIDLIHRRGNGWYDFIELKVSEKAGTPLFAAMEILQYGILYMFSRENAEVLANPSVDKGLFEAAGIHLKVLAPAEYYLEYSLGWLENSLNDGLSSFLAGGERGFTMDFRFESLSLIPKGSPVRWNATL